MRLLPKAVPLVLLILAVAVFIGGGAALFWDRAQAGLDAAAGEGATAALWSGSIVVRNDSEAPATVVVNFYSTAGVLVKSYALPAPIPPKGVTSVHTEAISDLPNGFAGSAVVSANQPVSVTFVGFDASDPLINRTIYNGFSTGSDTVYVPAISNSYADQSSTLAVQNVDSVSATVTIRYFERFTGAQTAMVTDTLPPNSSHFYDSGNLPSGQRLPPPWTGAALVQSIGGRVVAVVHQPYLSSNRAVAFEGTTSVGTSVYLPSALYHYAEQRQTTFIAVQNTQGNPITVTTTFYAGDGAVAGEVSGNIDGFQKQSWNPGSAGITPGFNGSAVVRASGPVAAVVNIGSATDLSLAYTGQLQGTLKQSLPFIRWSHSSGAKGWLTYIAVVNTDEAFPADFTIRYYDENGLLVQAPSFINVPPHGKINHHPGMFVGDAPFTGTVEILASRTIAALVNAVTVDGTQGESYTGVAIP